MAYLVPFPRLTVTSVENCKLFQPPGNLTSLLMEFPSKFCNGRTLKNYRVTVIPLSDGGKSMTNVHLFRYNYIQEDV